MLLTWSSAKSGILVSICMGSERPVNHSVEWAQNLGNTISVHVSWRRPLDHEMCSLFMLGVSTCFYQDCATGVLDAT